MVTQPVHVHLFAAARAAVGQSVLDVPSGTLAQILSGVERSHPDFASVRGRCSMSMARWVTRRARQESSPPEMPTTALVGGRRVGDDTVLAIDATVDVLPPFAGG